MASRIPAPAWFAPCADLVRDLTDEQRGRIMAVTHSGWLEGTPPTRAVVAHMAAVERGTLTADAAVTALLAHQGN